MNDNFDRAFLHLMKHEGGYIHHKSDPRYWNLVRGDELPSGVDYCAFDVAVNSGVGRAVRFLQLASGVVADGLIGPGTMGAIAKIDPKELVKKICDERREFLHRLETFDTFGKGWMRRVTDVERVALEMADGPA